MKALTTTDRAVSLGSLGVSRPQCQPSHPTWVDDADGSSSVSADSCWDEMEDLVGEENADWGLLLAPAVPFQALTDAVEGGVSAPSGVPEVHREGVVPPRSGRRVVLVPGSPDATLQSIQGTPSSLVSNRFAIWADEDPLTGKGQEEFAVATRAESGLSDHGRMAFPIQVPANRPKRLRLVGQFQRVSQATECSSRDVRNV